MANVFELKEFDITDKNIILAVKPYALNDVSINLKGISNTLYSILAGTTIESLKESIDSKSYIRVMPNVSAKFQASTSVITGDIEKKRRRWIYFHLLEIPFGLIAKKR